MKTPHEYLSELEKQTLLYVQLCELWADLMKDQADYYQLHRQDHKSDTAVQRAFDRTQKGMEMSVCKMKLKAKEKQMSTIRTALRLLDTEARNLL